jgi:hypothetical protein
VLCLAASLTKVGGSWGSPAYQANGWTLIKESICEPGSGVQGYYMVTLYRILAAGESAYQVFTAVGSNITQWAMLAYSGQGSSPIDASGDTLQTTAASTLVAPSVTTTGVYHQLLLFYLPSTGGGNYTLPAGATSQVSLGGAPSIVIADKQIASASATGTQTLTYLFGGSSVGIAQSVALAASHVPIQITGFGNIDATERIGVPQVGVNPGPDPAGDALKDDGDEIVMLVEAHPYDAGGISEVPQYFSDREFANDPPGYYEPIVQDGLNISRSIFGNNQGQIGGRGLPSYTDIKLLTGQDSDPKEPTSFDELKALAWDSRYVDVKVGARGISYSQFRRAQRAKAAHYLPGLRVSTIALADPSLPFNRDVQKLFYAGTGGLEGGVDLANKPKPIAVGMLRNVTPILVDKEALIYQFHKDAAGTTCAAVTAVYSGGYPFLTSDYVVDLSTGTFQLLTAPAPNSLVTCDVTGPSAVGYTTAELISYFASTIGPLTFPGDFNTSAHYSFLAAYPGNAGMYLDSATSIGSVIDELLAPGGFLTLDQNGKLLYGLWRLPFGTPKLALLDDEGDILDIVPLSCDPPATKLQLDWGRNFTLQNAQGEAGGISTSQAAFANEEYRTLSSPDPIDATTPGRWPSAGPLHLVSQLVVESDAQEELDRLSEIYGAEWEAYQVDCGPQGLLLDIGDLVFVRHPRFGLESGALFRVAGLTYGQKRVSITAWKVATKFALGDPSTGFALGDATAGIALGAG